MRSLLISAALPLLAQALEFRDDTEVIQNPGLLRFPVKTSQAAGKGLRARQDDVDLAEQRSGLMYTIDVVLGTPGQKVSVQFDTGSPSLWVNPQCSTAPYPDLCQNSGRFTKSTTLVDLQQKGQLPYNLGSVNVEWVYDYVTVGSSRLNQQIFGVGENSTDLSVGIMGASPDLTGWDSPYPLIIDSLATQGFTNSRAFSMDLRPVDDEQGSVIFGGIDTKKFTGPLHKLPIVPASQSPDKYTRYWVNVDGISITTDGTKNTVFDQTNGLTAFLDSGTTLSQIPTAMFNEVLKAFPGARKDTQYNQWYVDCSLVDSTGFVSFKFGDVVIKAPFSDFLWQQPDNNVCVLGFAPDDNNSLILGDTFLHSAYTVFDWDNENVFVAQGDDCGSHLIPIGSGPDAVPDLTGDCGRPTTTSSSSVPSSTESSSKPTRSASTSVPGTSSPPVSSTTHATTTGWSNTTTAAPTYTSTFTTTQVHTITSCAPTVTNCPIGHVTTETLTTYTTWCPGNTAVPTTTATCPEITGTFTIPPAVCTKSSCPHITHTNPAVVTVVPIVTQTTTVEVPGCHSCGPAPTQPPVSTPVGTAPGISTFTQPCSTCGAPTPTVPVTAGAGEMYRVSGVVAFVAALALVAF